MKIGVLSDTHLTEPSDELRRIIEQYFKDTDIILHAGDIVGKSVLKAFSGRELKAVSGNMDSAEIKEMLPIKRIVTAGKYKIGLTHGYGCSVSSEKDIGRQFQDVDCIVYGHTHSPANHMLNEVLFFNPGALVDRWYGREGSIGILELNDTIKGKIIKV